MAQVSANATNSGQMTSNRHLRLVTDADIAVVLQRQQQWEAMKAGYPTPIRLTKRGRRLLAVLVLLPIAAFLWLNSSHSVAAADQGPVSRTVIVEQGQTLWDVAVANYPTADPRERVYFLKKINHLADSTLYPGQAIVVPIEK